MASASQFQGSTITIQYVTPDFSRPAQVVWSRSVPSNVLYPLEFAPLDIWTAELITSEREKWGEYWNENAAVPGVLGIGIGEEPNFEQVLEFVATVEITSTSGNSRSQINLRPRDWFPDTFPVPVRREVARLDAIEAG